MTSAPETMLERAAKALAWECEWPTGPAWLNEATLAVLRAIREPDERVLEAMRGEVTELYDVYARSLVARIWQAGIDAIAEQSTGAAT